MINRILPRSVLTEYRIIYFICNMNFSLQAHKKSKVTHVNMREISAAILWTSGNHYGMFRIPV
jgi:hypothetical protein